VILAGLVPPLSLPLLVVTGLAAAVTLAENTLENEDTLENTVEKLLDRRQEREAKPEPSEPATPKTEEYRHQRRLNKRKTRNVKLEEEITRLQNQVGELTNQVVDLQAARAANVTVIRFEVATGVQAVA
jgi:predicted nuclease with TOPRIM domain